MKNITQNLKKFKKFQNYNKFSNKGFFNNKVYPSSKEAIFDVKSGNSILLGGFGICGIPENLIAELSKKDVKNLDIISSNGGIVGFGCGMLLEKNQVKRLTGSYLGENKVLERMYLEGQLELNFTPQGTLAEKIRSGGAGIPGFYTPTGYGTFVQEGGIPIKLDSNNPKGPPLIVSNPKPVKEINGRHYVYEESITADFAFVKAWKGDKLGNLIFRKTASNFNFDMATSGKITIAEVEELVELGELDSNSIHCPGIYVQRIVKGEKYEKRLERKISSNEANECPLKNRIAKRAAEELKQGYYVNLGIGIPNFVPDHIPKNKAVIIHTENGMLGVGPHPKPGNEDCDLIAADKKAVTELLGCSYFRSSESFGMIRGRHIDLTLLGALQVSEKGDLANWIIPGKMVKGMGGAMDLVSSGGKVIVLMEHTSKNEIKILEKCNLPLTGKRVVNKIITEMGVFEIDEKGLIMTDIFKGVEMKTVINLTGCKFRISEKLRKLDY